MQATLASTLVTIEGLLIQPSLTLPLGGCLRGQLLRVVSHLTEQAISAARAVQHQHGHHGGADGPAAAVALAWLLDAASHLER